MSESFRIPKKTSMSCRLMFSGAIVFAMLLFACSCNEASDAPDGDTPADGDSDTALDGDASDPCDGAAVDCSPGSCESHDGKPVCSCPDGYHAVRYSCQPDTPSDGDVIDGDVSDGDTVDGDSDPDADSPDGDGDTQNVPACTAANDIFPCRMNLPFEDVDNAGLFRIGVYRNPVYGMDTWKSWIVAAFTIFRTETDYPIGGGIFLINMLTREMYKLGHQGENDLDPQINEGHVIWAAVDYGPTDSESDDTAELFLIDIETMTARRITDSPSYKFGLAYEASHPYWLDLRMRLGQFGNPIYSLDDHDSEIRIDTETEGEGPTAFSVSGNILAYVTGNGVIGIIDRTNNTQRLLPVPSNVYYRPNSTLLNNLLYYSDNRDYPDGDPTSTTCWTSLYQYNITNDTETVIHQNIDGKDYLIEDAWGDWLLFSYYAEGHSGTDDPQFQYCGMSAADGDLFLRYMPTGEEWNITNHVGNQRKASMWGPLVVWHDTRNNLTPTYGFGELYGLDLCQHPELKDRFEECAER
jgi:hypothetical protein